MTDSSLLWNTENTEDRVVLKSSSYSSLTAILTTIMSDDGKYKMVDGRNKRKVHRTLVYYATCSFTCFPLLQLVAQKKFNQNFHNTMDLSIFFKINDYKRHMNRISVSTQESRTFIKSSQRVKISGRFSIC